MRVWQVEGQWSMDNVKPALRPDPQPGPRQIRLAMRVCALNYRDLVVPLRGYGARMKELPLVMLCDGVGVVDAVGPGVTRFAVGDRVCPTLFPRWIDGPPDSTKLSLSLGSELDGTLAEAMVVDEDAACAVPAHLTDAEAATLPTAAVTAWHALVTEGRLAPGDTVLVQGCGGVSLFALQFAHMLGARVIVTSSSDERLERARALGADAGINYVSDPDWSKRVRELSGGRGVDQLIEVGGSGTLAQSLRAVRTGGTVSLIGVLAGAELTGSLGLVVTRHVRLQGITGGSRADFEAMAAAIAAHGMRPVVDRVFDSGQLLEALALLRSGRQFGKIALRV
ncbi:zinc-dependent alcohol dehydrogenase family protein [Derxia lacustris]|uniref:zinc-dependent alcohol dehydrogenase family protein n=1 Tax=Derxia lacustris TaxID=764842 RepID=UPI000A176A33|nr:NAD(P)-dependent alcohol dehydrogenase [Derxia lacustris]